MKMFVRRLLVLLTVITSMLGVIAPAAYADQESDSGSGDTKGTATTVSSSNTYQLFIQLAQNKKLTTADAEMFGNITSEEAQRQWQFFGVLLSNYYAPFSTDLKSDKLTDPKTAGGAAYKNMLSLLTSSDGGFKFDKDVAKSIAQGVLGSVQKDSEDLRFGYCKSANHHVSKDMIDKASTKATWKLKEGQCFLDNTGEEPVTWYSLLSAAAGDFPSSAKGFVLNKGGLISKGSLIMNSYAKDGNISGLDAEASASWKTKLGIAVGDGFGNNDTYFGEGAKRNANTVVVYGTKSKFPAFVADMYGEELTPSVQTVMNILRHTATGMGYGTNLIDTPEVSTDPSKLNDANYLGDLLSKVVDPSKYYTFGIPLKLSPFGDLWADGAESSLIVMPGAANPMIYQAVDKKGNDVKSLRGLGQGVLSTFWLQALNEDWIGDSSKSKKVCDTLKDTNPNLTCSQVRNKMYAAPLNDRVDGNYSILAPGEEASHGEQNLDIPDIKGGTGAFGAQKEFGDTVFTMGKRRAVLVRGASESAISGSTGFGAWLKGLLPGTQGADKNQLNMQKGFQAFVKAHPKTSMRMVRVVGAYNNGDWWDKGAARTSFGFPYFNYPAMGGNKDTMLFSGHHLDSSSGTRIQGYFGNDDKDADLPIGDTKARPIYDNLLLVDDLGLVSSLSGDSDSDSSSSDSNSSDSEDNKDDKDNQDSTNKGESTVSDGEINTSGVAVCSARALVGKGGNECKPADGSIKSKDQTTDGFADAVKGATTKLDGSNQPKNGETLSIDIANPKMKAMFIMTYMAASQTKDSSNKDIKTTWSNLGYRFVLEELPAPKHFTLDASVDNSEDKMAKEIKNWIWYLLNPTVGFRYKMTLLSGAISSVFIGWHNDMVGASGVGNLPGTTKYTGFNGYVTTPTLSDMEWSDQVVSWYKDHLLLIIVIVALILVCFVVTNTIGMQKAVVSLVAFTVLALIPAAAVNAVATVSNDISDRLYSGKFTYWALAQHQTYSQGISDAINNGKGSDDITAYMRSIYGISGNDSSSGGAGLYNAGGNRGASIATPDKSTSFDYNSQGDNNILLKWQAPKKMSGTLINTESDGSYLGIKASWMSMLGNVLQGGFDGQTFNKDNNSYLYRDYTDLGNYSQYIYLALTQGSPNGSKVPYNESVDSSWWDANLKTMYANAGTTKDLDKTYGLNNFGDGMPKHWVMPFGSGIYNTGIHKADISNLTQGQTAGISPNCLNIGLPAFNSYGKGDYQTFASNKNLSGCFAQGGDFTGKTEGDVGSFSAYALMSESPFFWESWNLYDQGLSPMVGSSGGFKSTILPSGGKGYFYDDSADDGNDSTVSTGEMKDYLDMKGLFTYFIPYARMGNAIVNKYFDTYGRTYYNGISSEDGHADDYKSDPEALRKYWHNVNLAHLYSIYTPWVDLMDQAGYSHPVTVSYNGKHYTIDNPTDPAQYPADRPMVFSKAEQARYGLKDSQLTTVERKIQKVAEDTESDYIDLLNYYTFSDNVLDTAAAMRFTFNFNRIFSESKPAGIGGDVVTLYPQNYELKNFTYDAYLRLIINSSTGQSLNGYSYNSKDNTGAGFYAQTVQNSSLTTALGFIVLDVLAIYVVPVLKAVFVVGIYLMLIILLLATVFKLEDNPWGKFVTTMGKPLGIFFAITTAMAFVVSLFMSSGSNAVTGDQQFVIRLGDPTLVVAAMVFINCLVAFAYLMLAKKLCLNIWRNGRDVALSVAGVVGGVGKALAAGVSSAIKGQGFKQGYSQSLKTGSAGNGGAGNTFGGKATTGSFAGNANSGATGRTAVLFAKKDATETRRRALNSWRQRKAEDAEIQRNDRTTQEGSNGFGGDKKTQESSGKSNSGFLSLGGDTQDRKSKNENSGGSKTTGRPFSNPNKGNDLV